MPKVELHVPGLKEMHLRQAWLSDPETMAYNRGRDLGGAEGYHPDTGCIDFPRENWRYWRQVWLMNEPDFYSAYICDTETGEYVGEACWFYDGEQQAHIVGILIEAGSRGLGYCAPALKALMAHAFRHEEIGVLRCDVPLDNLPALKGYARAGFHRFGERDGMAAMIYTHEDWEREQS